MQQLCGSARADTMAPPVATAAKPSLLRPRSHRRLLCRSAGLEPISLARCSDGLSSLTSRAVGANKSQKRSGCIETSTSARQQVVINAQSSSQAPSSTGAISRLSKSRPAHAVAAIPALQAAGGSRLGRPSSLRAPNLDLIQASVKEAVKRPELAKPVSAAASNSRLRQASLFARRQASQPSQARPPRSTEGLARPEALSSRTLVELARGRQLEHQRRQQQAAKVSLAPSGSSLLLASAKRPKQASASAGVRPMQTMAAEQRDKKQQMAAEQQRQQRQKQQRIAIAQSQPAHRAFISSATGNGNSHDNENIRATLDDLLARSHLCDNNKILQQEPCKARALDKDDEYFLELAGNLLDKQMAIGSPLITPSPSESDLDEGDVASDGEIKNETRKASAVVGAAPEPPKLAGSPVGASAGNPGPVGASAGQLPPLLARDSLKRIDIPIKHLESVHDHYDLESRPFARGKFAQVKRCTSKTTRQCFAAKCIKKRRRLVDIRHEILLEIEALKLSYITDRIVKLYEVYETPSEMILVLEMANGGELQRVIDDEETIDEQIVRRMICQILEGLMYLHDQDIAHLDIKPQNLLLTDSFPNGSVKLCDFGISRRITKDCEIREICGTPDYVAPEILRYDPICLATDMWSLGVLTYVLLSGYSPFGSENKQQTFCNITQATLDFPSEIFAKTSKDAIDFMQKLIVRDPGERLTSRQARNHPWLVNVKA